MLCYHLLLGGAVSEFTPTVYSIKSSAECGQYNPLHDQELKKKLIETVARLPRTHRSCAAILNGNPSAPSGYYNITTTNGSSIQVYCDMEGTNCGGEGGWTRVAYVNMTQPGASCPQGLEQQSLNTVVGSHQEKVVCLQQSRLASVTSRCVDEWLDMKRMVLMDFGHLTNVV